MDSARVIRRVIARQFSVIPRYNDERMKQSKLYYGVNSTWIAAVLIVSLFAVERNVAVALSSNSVNKRSASAAPFFATSDVLWVREATEAPSVTQPPLATTNDYVDDRISDRYSHGVESVSRARSNRFYKRLVVGSDGGRPQVTALEMVCNDASSESTTFQQFDKNEFEMHVGRALDTLRRDYPKILLEDPDYAIYDPRVVVVDPSGVRVRGLTAYKNAFRLLHTLVRILYCPSKSGISMRLCYDQARCVIRIHWNAYVVPREIFGGSRTTNHVDGISVYEFDRFSGNITEHRFERLLINDAPVTPEEGVIAALQQHTVSVPMFIQRHQEEARRQSNIVVPFQQDNPLQNVLNLFEPGRNGNPSSLFALEAANDDKSSFEEVDDADHSQYPNLDWVAYRSKNQSRKKFGLKPITPEEFMEIEAQVREMTLLQQERMMQEQRQVSSSSENDRDKKKGGLLSKMFGNVLQDTCESNFDCERPEICCDFGFQKRCCFAGTPVGKWNQLQPIRVPANVENYPGRHDPRNY